MKNKPILTVFMPVYNAEKYLAKAIESILDQTFQDFEFLIINDGSKDYSLKIIQSYQDSRIRLIEHQTNQGLIFTSNQGLEEAKGKYIARMDADDIAMPNRLKVQSDYLLEHPEVIVLGSDMMIIDEFDNDIIYQPTLTESRAIKNSLHVACPFIQPSVMFNREVVMKVGGYSAGIVVAEDYNLWVKLINEGDFANIGLPLLKYRVNPTGETHSKGEILKQNAEIIASRLWYENNDPMPKNKWHLLWPAKSEVIKQRPFEYKYYAQLHILFAKAYLLRGKLWKSIAHIFGAIDWTPLSVYSYFYLLMYLMPYDKFLQLEQGVAKKVKKNEKMGRQVDKNSDVLVSVVIPCFNKGDLILDTIKSVLASTHKKLEIIIINDGSTDKKTIDALDAITHKHPEISVVNSINQGVAIARNTGLELSKGEYVLLLDNDDLIFSNYIEKCLTEITNNKSLDFVYTGQILFSSNSKRLVHPTEFNLNKLKRFNYIPVTCLYKTEKIRKFNFNKEINIFEDWDFILSATLNGLVGKAINSTFLCYRQLPASRNKTQTSLLSVIKMIDEKILAPKNLQLGLLQIFIILFLYPFSSRINNLISDINYYLRYRRDEQFKKEIDILKI